MHIKRFLFTALVLFALVGLASAEQVCTESEYKGRTIQKCRDTGSPGCCFLPGTATHRITITSISRKLTHWEITVAIAAPAAPMGEKPSFPKISM